MNPDGIKLEKPNPGDKTHMCCGEPNTTCVGSSLPTFLLSPEQVFFPQSGHSDTELWEGPVGERCCLYEASSTVATVFFFFCLFVCFF